MFRLIRLRPAWAISRRCLAEARRWSPTPYQPPRPPPRRKSGTSIVTSIAPIRRQGLDFPSLFLWSIISSLFCAYFVMAVLGLVRINPSDLVLAVLASAVGLSLWAFYTFNRPDERIARLSRGMVELFLLSFLCGSLSYLAAALNRPLWDEVFDMWDKALGFHWKDWLLVLNSHPRVHLVLAAAYHSMIPQFIGVVVALVTARAFKTLDTFLIAFGIAATATVSISAMMPALSPLVYYNIVPSDYPNIVLAVPLEFASQVTALRDGSMRLVDLSGAQGLVTFPSFHTASGVLLFLAFWQVPYLRWIFAALNVVLITSVTLEGSHFLVDVLAGTAVALVSWWTADRIVRFNPSVVSRILEASVGRRLPELAPEAARRTIRPRLE
ncbi:phosphatase PAP2 family protein [Microvirga sp. M8]|nr:phosphatase PAP2 family protein [Microvirga tunisiensis]